MVEFRVSDYSGEKIEPGTGIRLVKNNGVVIDFKNSKEIKNYEIGRDPQDLGWVHKNPNHRETGPKHLNEMDQELQIIFDLLNEEGHPENWSETLRNKGKILSEEIRLYSDPNLLSPDQIVASIGVVPVVDADDRRDLIRAIDRFAEDSPVGTPENSGTNSWSDLYTESRRFLDKKENIYQQLRRENIGDVDELRKKQLQAFLADRLRYVNYRLQSSE